ncbi:unnamed protein product, partial [marine sediment metagenome]
EYNGKSTVTRVSHKMFSIIRTTISASNLYQIDLF